MANISKIQTNNIFFYTSDKNTTNIYIQILGEYQDLSLEIVIVPPNAQERKEVIIIQAKKLDDKLYEFLAPNTVEGTYKCQIRCINGDKFNTSDRFTYEVKENLVRNDE